MQDVEQRTWVESKEAPVFVFNMLLTIPVTNSDSFVLTYKTRNKKLFGLPNFKLWTVRQFKNIKKI